MKPPRSAPGSASSAWLPALCPDLCPVRGPFPNASQGTQGGLPPPQPRGPRTGPAHTLAARGSAPSAWRAGTPRSQSPTDRGARPGLPSTPRVETHWTDAAVHRSRREQTSPRTEKTERVARGGGGEDGGARLRGVPRGSSGREGCCSPNAARRPTQVTRGKPAQEVPTGAAGAQVCRAPEKPGSPLRGAGTGDQGPRPSSGAHLSRGSRISGRALASRDGQHRDPVPGAHGPLAQRPGAWRGPTWHEPGCPPGRPAVPRPRHRAYSSDDSSRRRAPCPRCPWG